MFNQREVSQKVGKEEKSFLYATHCPNLIHTAIKFHQDIPYGFLVIARTMIVWKIK